MHYNIYTFLRPWVKSSQLKRTSILPVAHPDRITFGTRGWVHGTRLFWLWTTSEHRERRAAWQKTRSTPNEALSSIPAPHPLQCYIFYGGDYIVIINMPYEYDHGCTSTTWSCFTIVHEGGATKEREGLVILDLSLRHSKADKIINGHSCKNLHIFILKMRIF